MKEQTKSFIFSACDDLSCDWRFGRTTKIFKLKLGGLKFGNVWFTVRWQKTAHKLSLAEKVKQTTWTTTSQPLGEVIIHTVNRRSSDQFMGLTVKSYCMIILTLLTQQRAGLIYRICTHMCCHIFTIVEICTRVTCKNFIYPVFLSFILTFKYKV